MTTEPIIGRGRDGKPQTARQAFASVMDDAIKEWEMQSKLADDDPRFKDMSEARKHAYLTQRLIHHLANLISLWPQIPKGTE